uniref:Uncharacterized protein n=1 Tax=Arundo donax TaxID=35708 RepID=A0A0A8ZU30_ARUDO
MVQSEKRHKLKTRRDGTSRISWYGSVSAGWNSTSSLDQVQRILQGKLNGRTILVVLDVWNEMSSHGRIYENPSSLPVRAAKCY